MANKNKPIKPTGKASPKSSGRRGTTSVNKIGRTNRWQRNGLARFHASMSNSIDGLRAVFASEQAFRWGIYLGLIFFGGLFLTNYITGLELRRTEWLFLLSGYLMLLAFELINSSMEILSDMVHPHYHRLIKAAKDMGSAAVFLCYLFNGVVWFTLVVLPVIKLFF